MRLLKLIPDQTNIDFVGNRYYAFAIDGLLVLITVILLVTRGLNFGIDFTGGVLVEVKGQQAIEIGAMRERVGTLGFGEAQLQYVTGGECDMPANSCVLIRVQPEAETDPQATASMIQTALGAGYEFRRVEVVGPRVSGELLQSGIYATLLAVLGIGLYVVVRFEWQYGVGAIVATAHDVLVTVGLYSLLQWDFTLTSVAALLTLAGYSVNDTVVVYDRIRENRRRFKKMPLVELINLSTNQTLSRTVLTGTTVLLSLIPLMYLGGPALFDFTAAIMFGIVVGTFSSVFVAAALLIYLPSVGGHEEPAQRRAARAKP
jgi:preprotein translocase SecF subunit